MRYLIRPAPAWMLGMLGLGLGLGPVGLAFYTWDHAFKHGDIRVLGARACAAPLLSTLLLILFGPGEASWFVLPAMALIFGGAALAAQEMLRRRA